MPVPDVTHAMQTARGVAAVAPPPRKRMQFVAPLMRRRGFWWWEFDSDVKRRLALEILMRKMFAIVPNLPNAAFCASTA
jgi:hypothetical protein